MGKNKLSKWNEFGSFPNVIQPVTEEISGADHIIKGNWCKTIFKNDNPLVLELGCGKGEYTVGLASLFPGNNYVGVDIKGARMWRGAKTSNEEKIANAAFLRTRIEFIGSFFSEDEVDEIWITFPDPHPGTRNSGKRLSSPAFLKRYKGFLKNNSIIHLKTDNDELYKYTLSVIKNHGFELLISTNDLYGESDSLTSGTALRNSGISHAKPTDFVENILSIKTHYEKLFLQQGMKIKYLAFRLNREKLIQNA